MAAPENSAENVDYAAAYSERSLREKLAHYARAAGRDVVERALLLYYAAQRESTPAWAKTAIVGALGYFIAPVDAIADLLPAVGYADDLGVLALAVATVAVYINDEVRERAQGKLQDWFGPAADDGPADDAPADDGAPELTGGKPGDKVS